MGEIIPLFANAPVVDPHWSGEVVCVACKHTWVATGPVDTMHVECPSCFRVTGTPRNMFGAPADALVLMCACGCEAVTIFKKDDYNYVWCVSCGGDLTEVAWS